MRALSVIPLLSLAFAQPVMAQTAPAMDAAKAVAAALAANGGDVAGIFEMQVASTGAGGFNFYLNSATDYRDAGNLAILIEPAGRNAIKAKYGVEPDVAFANKRIRVKGIARRVPVGSHFQTRVTVDSGDQIEIIG